MSNYYLIENKKVALHFEDVHYTEISFKFSYSVYRFAVLLRKAKISSLTKLSRWPNISILQNGKSLCRLSQS